MTGNIPRLLAAAFSAAILFVMVQIWPAGGWALSSLSPLPIFLFSLSASPVQLKSSIILSIILCSVYSYGSSLLFVRHLLSSYILFKGIKLGWGTVRIISLFSIIALMLSAIIIPLSLYVDHEMILTDTSEGSPGIFETLSSEIEKGTLSLIEQNSSGNNSSMLQAIKYVYALIPFMIFMEHLASALLLIAVTRAVLKGLHRQYAIPEPFTQFSLPWQTVWGLIAGISGLMLLEPEHPAGAAMISVLAVSILYFGIQGLSLAEFYMNKYSFSPALKTAAYLVILLAGIWPMLLAAGVFDTWHNLRKSDRKENI